MKVNFLAAVYFLFAVAAYAEVGTESSSTVPIIVNDVNIVDGQISKELVGGFYLVGGSLPMFGGTSIPAGNGIYNKYDIKMMFGRTPDSLDHPIPTEIRFATPTYLSIPLVASSVVPLVSGAVGTAYVSALPGSGIVTVQLVNGKWYAYTSIDHRSYYRFESAACGTTTCGSFGNLQAIATENLETILDSTACSNPPNPSPRNSGLIQCVTDPHGIQTHITKNSKGYISNMSIDGGASYNFVQDMNYDLTSISGNSLNGGTTLITLGYTSPYLGKVTSISNAANSTSWNFHYNGYQVVDYTWGVNSSGVQVADSTFFTYGNPTLVTTPQSTASYSFDSSLRTTHYIDANKDITYSYYFTPGFLVGQSVTTITSPSGAKTVQTKKMTYNTDSSSSQLPVGNLLTYWEGGKLLEQRVYDTTDPTGWRLKTDYNYSTGTTTSYSYNSSNQVISAIATAPTYYTYDANGFVASVQYNGPSYPETHSSLGDLTAAAGYNFSFDSNFAGVLSSHISPDGSVNLAILEKGSAGGHSVVNYSYPASASGESGVTSTYNYDANNVLYSSSSSLGYSSSVSYDSTGTTVTERPGDGTSTIKFTAFDNSSGNSKFVSGSSTPVTFYYWTTYLLTNPNSGGTAIK